MEKWYYNDMLHIYRGVIVVAITGNPYTASRSVDNPTHLGVSSNYALNYTLGCIMCIPLWRVTIYTHDGKPPIALQSSVLN